MTRVEHAHLIELPMAVDKVFPLFTPKGEMEWIEDWKPQFIFPKDGATCKGMVFTTRNNGEPTFWSCVEWDPAAHNVRYARVTPSAKFGDVAVTCREIGPEETEVRVGYVYTALSPRGEAELAAFTQPVFEKINDGWRELILSRFNEAEYA